MLSGIKRELSDIRHALLALDDSKLSIDDLRAISRQLPTAEEVRQSPCRYSSPFNISSNQIARLRDFDDVSKLAKADQYFFQVCPFAFGSAAQLTDSTDHDHTSVVSAFGVHAVSAEARARNRGDSPRVEHRSERVTRAAIINKVQDRPPGEDYIASRLQMSNCDLSPKGCPCCWKRSERLDLPGKCQRISA